MLILFITLFSSQNLLAQKAIFEDFDGNILDNGQTVHIEDSLALVAFYSAMNGPNWFNNAGWLVDGVEFWHGITHVTEVNPDEWRVTRIMIRENFLQGELPPELGNMVYLERIDLRDNYIYGPIPNEIGSMVSLTHFDMRRNILTGEPPWEQLVSLPNLTFMSIESNRLEGHIPAIFGNFPRLNELEMHNNKFSGPIPPEIGNVTTLTRLRLGDAYFTGDIPAELGNLPNLQRLTLRNVPFINPAPFPAWLRDKAETIQRIEMQGAQLTGEIPEWINELYKLEQLTLGGGDEIGGPIPDMTFLTNLDFLDLSKANFTGPIPEWVSIMPALQRLAIQDNPITGQIPADLGNAPSMDRLVLKNLQLEGPMPDLRNLNLDRLELENIGFDIGPIPDWVGTQGRLDRIIMINVGLSGQIPEFLGQLDALVRLDLTDNPGLSGELPTWLINKQDIAYLNLSRTGLNLGDEIPAWLANRNRLERLGLAGLGLNGPIPEWMGNLLLMNKIALDDNNLTGEIPASLGDLSLLDSLNIGNNNLAGEIPIQLANAGRVGPVTLMNSVILSGNENLTGEVPATFSEWDPEVMRVFWIDDTGLCIPAESSLNNWLDGVAFHQNPNVYTSVRLSDVECSVTSLNGDQNNPYRFMLSQSYPNPFNPATTIRYEIPDNSHVSLLVYNILGMHVATLVNEEKSAGAYDVQFNAGNLASGTYFYRLQAGNRTQVKRMMLLK